MMNHGTEKRWKFRLQSGSHFVFAGSWNPRPPFCDFTSKPEIVTICTILLTIP
jgi:putative SOS response-associated peptidase YedK